jgi:hypothetical protein
VLPERDALTSPHHASARPRTRRTTLDIDPDVLSAVKDRARRERRSAGAVLSDLARRALTAPTQPEPADDGASFHGFRPLPSGGRIVSEETIERLRDELGV